ncbi:hypothetical protein sos41_11980 [Alphaproteobacteria bacterium SO-S41]|nr:hypothetical protein sos41_11980 [Alphaproteobacteria bacterium SO-S41]
MSEADAPMSGDDIKALELQLAKARRTNGALALALIEGERGQAAVAALTEAAEVFKGEAFTAFVTDLKAAAANLDADNPVYGTVTNLLSVMTGSAQQGTVLAAIQAIKAAPGLGTPGIETLDRRISGQTGLPPRS